MCQLCRAAVICLLPVISVSAFATSQCPSEFGPKDSSVDALGWLIVLVGISLGGLLFWYVVKQSRGTGLFKQVAIIVLGMAGLVVLGLGGLALAIEFFFLQC